MNYRPVDIDATITLVNRQIAQFWWNDSTQSTGDVQAMLTNLDETQTLSWTGDAKNTVLEAGAKWWRALSNRVEMGLGMTVTRSKYEQDYTEVGEGTEITRFDDGFGTLGGNELDTFQGGLGGYNEEQTVIQSRYTTDITDEVKMTDVRMPVGAQFNITKKIKWQMGVQHQIRYMTRETSFARGTGNDETGVEITTYTDYANPANDTVAYDTFQHISGNETVTDKDKYNQTTYWYGLEWLVGDTAQFNINGFFDSHASWDYPDPQFSGDNGNEIWDVDFFRNLAVSLTFLFD
jgi:hypothetical protein